MRSGVVRSLVVALVAAACVAGLGLAMAETVRSYGTGLRGVSLSGAGFDGSPRAFPGLSDVGVNLRLHEEQPDKVASELDAAGRTGVGWVRQPFPWSQIEPEQGRYQWQPFDRIVELATARGLRIVAVVDTSPPWARADDSITSPPSDPDAYARFVSELTRRYRGKIAAYQVWDEPNIAPHWGPRYASAGEYVALLKAAYPAIKAADPGALVLAGGLAPTTESSQWNLSDVAYLQAMYHEGARGWFDSLAMKPYGFWTGPEDRRVDAGVLNFSRAVLLREVMERNGDGGRPVWAVEMGWNAPPAGWTGRPSPWGSDAESVQARRTVESVARARSEWPWLTTMMLPALRYPAAAPDDPVRGFALLNDDLSPRATLSALTPNAVDSAMRSPESFRQDLGLYVTALVLLTAGLAMALWVAATAALALPWSALETSVVGLPASVQVGLLAMLLVVFQASPWWPASLGAAILLFGMMFVRPDLGLAAAAASIPFCWQTPRVLGGWEFSALEVLTVSGVAAWLVRAAVARKSESAPLARPMEDAGAFWRGQLARLPATDLAVAFFAALALLSLAAAADLKVATRELRTVVLEPVLLYLLVTRGPGAASPRARGLPGLLAAGLVAGGVAAAALGLVQYLFTDQVITAEAGLRRMLGPYPSPNALGLLLERVMPLAFSLYLSVVVVWRRASRGDRSAGVAWAAATAVMAAGVVLTFSVGAWAAAAAGCAVVAVRQPRRVALALAGAALVAGLLALPLLRTERVASHFDLTSLTTSAIRVAVWQSAAEMVADHPVTGVGLDGFLELYRSQYIRPEAWREPDLSHPHNLALEAWLSLGIAGPAAYAMLVAAFFLLAHRVWHRGQGALHGPIALGLAAALAAGLTHGLVDRFFAGAPDLSAFFFLSLGLLVVMERGAGKEPAPLA